MAKQRYINTHFWDDNYIVTLDPIEKLLFLYLLTNPLTEISGAYEISLRRVAFDTGIDRDMVGKIFNRFAEEDRVIYRDGWVLICNFIKHQSDNEKINAGIKTLLSRCPDWIMDRVSIEYAYRIDVQSHLNSNSNSNRDVIETKKREDVSNETKPLSVPKQKPNDDEWLATLKQESIYAHIDFDREVRKAQIWIADHQPRKFTKKFFKNWINSIEPPLNLPSNIKTVSHEDIEIQAKLKATQDAFYGK